MDMVMGMDMVMATDTVENNMKYFEASEDLLLFIMIID